MNRYSELDGLRAAFARARDERACHAITLVGYADVLAASGRVRK